MGFKSQFYTEFQPPKDYIMELILQEYSEKFRHKDGKSEKVWYK